MTVGTIETRCDTLRKMAGELAAAELPPDERAKVIALVTIGIGLLEGFLIDVARIADALERAAGSAPR
jgi:hypothetical protein